VKSGLMRFQEDEAVIKRVLIGGFDADLEDF